MDSRGPRDNGPRDSGPRGAPADNDNFQRDFNRNERTAERPARGGMDSRGPRDNGPRDSGPRDNAPRDSGRDAGRDAGPSDDAPRRRRFVGKKPEESKPAAPAAEAPPAQEQSTAPAPAAGTPDNKGGVDVGDGWTQV